MERVKGVKGRDEAIVSLELVPKDGFEWSKQSAFDLIMETGANNSYNFLVPAIEPDNFASTIIILV